MLFKKDFISIRLFSHSNFNLSISSSCCSNLDIKSLVSCFILLKPVRSLYEGINIIDVARNSSKSALHLKHTCLALYTCCKYSFASSILVIISILLYFI